MMKSLRQSVKFTFSSQEAKGRLFKGGIFSLLFFTVFFAFVITGYWMRVLCNSLEGRNYSLPKWDNLSQLFTEGVMPIIVSLIYILPFLLFLVLGEVFPMIFGPSPAIAVTIFVLRILSLLLASLLLPLAMIHFTVKNDTKAAFDFKSFFNFIKTNTSIYLSAWITTIIALIIALIVGFLLLGVGIFFTTFAATIFSLNLYGNIYRASEPFTDDLEGKQRASIIMPPPLH